MGYGVIQTSQGVLDVPVARTKLAIASALSSKGINVAAGSFSLDDIGSYTLDVELNIQSPSNDLPFTLELYNETLGAAVQTVESVAPAKSAPSNLWMGFELTVTDPAHQYSFYIYPTNRGYAITGRAFILFEINLRAMVSQPVDSPSLFGDGSDGSIIYDDVDARWEDGNGVALVTTPFMWTVAGPVLTLRRPFQFENVTVKNGSTLRSGETATGEYLYHRVSGTMTIEPGGLVDAGLAKPQKANLGDGGAERTTQGNGNAANSLYPAQCAVHGVGACGGAGGGDGVRVGGDGGAVHLNADPSSGYGNPISPTTFFASGVGASGAVGAGANGIDNTGESPWTIRASAADNQWRSVCWSPELGLFCAVASSGAGNRVMTSPDGINWTIRVSAADNYWESVCWSPQLGLFCAVGRSGTGDRVMTSPDGINWTIQASAADNDWNRICWSPELGLFCAVAGSGAGNRVMTSPDGINWTIRASAADNGWNSVCWSPQLGLFCAVAYSGVGNRVMTSPDGINWTIQASAADNNWRSVCWSPELGLFCVVSFDGVGNGVMTSPDGINWTIRASAADNQWRSVCWSPELGLFCAVASSGAGNRVMTSPDGINWTIRASAADNGWYSVCWSPELELFCVVSFNGVGNRAQTCRPSGVRWPNTSIEAALMLPGSHATGGGGGALTLGGAQTASKGGAGGAGGRGGGAMRWDVNELVIQEGAEMSCDGENGTDGDDGIATDNAGDIAGGGAGGGGGGGGTLLVGVHKATLGGVIWTPGDGYWRFIHANGGLAGAKGDGYEFDDVARAASDGGTGAQGSRGLMLMEKLA